MKWLVAIFAVIFVSFLSGMTPAGLFFLRLAEKLPILLSVLLAAVFVRLARGMPSIPYEKVDASRARTATKAFRTLIKGYIYAFWIFVTAIILNLIVSLLKPDEIMAMPNWLASAILAAVDGLVIISIVFLIKSDVALAHLQADMIDQVIALTEKDEATETGKNVKKAFGSINPPRVRNIDDPGASN